MSKELGRSLKYTSVQKVCTRPVHKTYAQINFHLNSPTKASLSETEICPYRMVFIPKEMKNNAPKMSAAFLPAVTSIKTFSVSKETEINYGNLV